MNLTEEEFLKCEVHIHTTENLELTVQNVRNSQLQEPEILHVFGCYLQQTYNTQTIIASMLSKHLFEVLK